MKLGAPVPLGGTSLHIRRSVIEEVGRWDAFNVTEDADLGIRLARFGYRVLVLDSVTKEEANSDFVNWVRQRSRWYKGYIQTWLVHLRRPRRLYKELGGAGFLGFNLFVGGTPLLTLLNPLVWVLTLLWFVAEPQVIPSMFPGWVLLMALTCWVIGNAAFMYASIITVDVIGHTYLVSAALLTPLYWIMMSVAAAKAFWQLIIAPSFWEKTVHGLGDVGEGHKG
jgi:cellulose synthase/poly-beta-1,6-N-acetylglucosamine synthase-like glycosyltransferase